MLRCEVISVHVTFGVVTYPWSWLAKLGLLTKSKNDILN